MQSALLNSLKQKSVLLSDGALGTQLQAKGLKIGECPEQWNKNHPVIVREIAKEYFSAGSDMVLTNTFGGSSVKLKKFGLENAAKDLNRLGVELVRREAGTGKFVVASIGPTGEFMEPLGLLTEKEMIDIFAEQVKAMVEGGADAILAETMTGIEEACAAVKAIRENSDLPAFATMTFDAGAQGYRTMMGISIEQAADQLQMAGASIIGANCGNGIEGMIEITKQMKPLSSVPILVHANAGVPEMVGGKTVFRETPEMMAGKLPELLDAGASIVGGCCGTNPNHIKAFRTVIDQWLTK